MTRAMRGAVGVVVTWALAASAQAQGDSRVRGPLLTRTDAAIVGVAATASVALIGWDRAIADAARRPSVQGDRVLGSIADGANAYGDPGVLVAGAALWVSGRVWHDDSRRLIGVRSIEAIIAGGVVTGALKSLTGRARPYQSPDDARDFRLGRGFGSRSEYQSFPSGHATAAFAFASAVDAEWARLRPGRPAWVPAALYAAAALTGAARVYRDRHWASDVVMGSAIGFVAGRAVVRWHADHP